MSAAIDLDSYAEGRRLERGCPMVVSCGHRTRIAEPVAHRFIGHVERETLPSGNIRFRIDLGIVSVRGARRRRKFSTSRGPKFARLLTREDAERELRDIQARIARGESRESIAESYIPERAESAQERLMRKVRKAGSGCWIWTARTTDKGYGRFTLNGETVRAHRAAYELFVGPIPDGLSLDHLCRVRSCVNPAHLEPVTHRVNVLRGASPSAKNARKTHCKRGHPFSEENTYRRRNGRTCKACMRLWAQRRTASRSPVPRCSS